MKDIIVNFQKHYTCKVQLTTAVNFISFKDVDKESVMHSNSYNIEFMITQIIVDELFKSVFLRYQIGLEAQIRQRFYFRFSSNFVLKMWQNKF